GRAAQSVDGERLVRPAGGDSAAEARGNAVDRIVLADHLGLDPGGELGRVDGGEFVLLGGEGALPGGAGGQAVQDVHEGSRKITAFDDEDAGRGNGGEGDQDDGQDRGRPGECDQAQDDEETLEPAAHGNGSCTEVDANRASRAGDAVGAARG